MTKFLIYIQMLDQRPLQPDKAYLEELERKNQQAKKLASSYLKKGPALLPCQKFNHQNKQSIPQRKQGAKSKQKTKAQQYLEIKKRNLQKFGEKKIKQAENTENTQNKKIKPELMTVNYQPKKPIIDTQQYRRPGYKAKPKLEEPEPKLQYEKMLGYLKRVRSEFQKQREQFDKEKEKLKFKKLIEGQTGVKIQISSVYKQTQKQAKKAKEPQLQHAPERKQEKDQDSQRREEIETSFKYTVDRLFQCNPFTLRQIHNYVQRSQFLTSNSPLYHQAESVCSQRKGCPMKTIKPACSHGSLGANHSACSQPECTQQRVTKLQDGWYEVWVPGKHRALSNQQLGCKLVLFSNGDIKQQLSQGRVLLYQSAHGAVVEVRVQDQRPFWYFYERDQLQMKDDHGNTEIVYGDGRHEVVLASENI